MDDYRAAADYYAVIPAFHTVIPAKAGIQRVADNVIVIVAHSLAFSLGARASRPQRRG